MPHGRRGDSCQDCKGPAGEDVSGGFYSGGGGRVTKFGSPSAWMVCLHQLFCLLMCRELLVPKSMLGESALAPCVSSTVPRSPIPADQAAPCPVSQCGVTMTLGSR